MIKINLKSYYFLVLVFLIFIFSLKLKATEEYLKESENTNMSESILITEEVINEKKPVESIEEIPKINEENSVPQAGEINGNVNDFTSPDQEPHSGQDSANPPSFIQNVPNYPENLVPEKPIVEEKPEEKNVRNFLQKNPDGAENQTEIQNDKNVKKENTETFKLPEVSEDEVKKFESLLPEREKKEKKTHIIRGIISILLVISGISMIIILLVNNYSLKSNFKQENKIEDKIKDKNIESSNYDDIMFGGDKNETLTQEFEDIYKD